MCHVSTFEKIQVWGYNISDFLIDVLFGHVKNVKIDLAAKRLSFETCEVQLILSKSSFGKWVVMTEQYEN